MPSTKFGSVNTLNAQRSTYEDTGTTLGRGAFTTETLDFAIRIDFVVFEDGHLHLLALVLDLFWSLQ